MAKKFSKIAWMTQNAHFWSPCICSSMYIVSTNQLKLTSFLMTATIVMFKARTGARYELLSMIDLANLQTNQKVPKIMMSKPFVFMKTTFPVGLRGNFPITLLHFSWRRKLNPCLKKPEWMQLVCLPVMTSFQTRSKIKLEPDAGLQDLAKIQL